MSEYIRVKGKITEKTGGTSRVYAKGGIEHNSNGFIDYFAENYTYGEPEKYVPKQPEDSVNVFVGMFFDGTGNNRFNSESVYYSKIKSNGHRLSATDIPANQLKEITVQDENKNEKKVNVKITDRDSYWNPYSNVAKLYDLYKEIKAIDYEDKKNYPEYGKHLILKQYIEGIGTKKGKEDDILGSGLARSSWGILSRVNEGIEKVVDEQFSVVNSKKINKIVFDVFGFSRGAAAARHFCNEVKKGIEYKTIPKGRYDQGPAKVEIIPAGGFLGLKLKQKGYLPVGTSYVIEIRFLGIFDTVISDIVLKDNLGMKLAPVSMLFPIAQFALQPINTDIRNLAIGKTFHITAQNEWRANFALTPTNKNYTLGMLGSHSDIGGGYAELEKYEPILDYFDVGKDETKNAKLWEEKNWHKSFYLNNLFCLNYADRKPTIDFINTYDHYIETNATPLIDKYLSQYDTKYVDRPADYVVVNERIYDPTKSHTIDEQKISDHYVLQDSRYLCNKYSLVAFNLMLEYAIKHDVPFYKKPTDSPFIKKDMLFEYQIPDEKEFEKLQEYLGLMRKVVFDGKGTKYEIPSDLYHHIMNKYIHLSAHYGGLENDYVKIKGGDHSILGNLGFVNHPVKYSLDDNDKIQFKRELYVP